jgi:hypothetical protein
MGQNAQGELSRESDMKITLAVMNGAALLICVCMFLFFSIVCLVMSTWHVSVIVLIWAWGHASTDSIVSTATAFTLVVWVIIACYLCYRLGYEVCEAGNQWSWSRVRDILKAFVCIFTEE